MKRENHWRLDKREEPNGLATSYLTVIYACIYACAEAKNIMQKLTGVNFILENRTKICLNKRNEGSNDHPQCSGYSQP